ncbi:hypothetical protein YPF_4901 (plasmid) [Yersinia pestis biovar Orientalis str. India 195]|nr:hypothetical protein YPF_4901 [Yersinia pestis biovar Orientalis str. India 195]
MAFPVSVETDLLFFESSDNPQVSPLSLRLPALK